MKTQADISKEMRDQLKILDPEISLEPGTPERKIIDVVAQAIAEANVDVFVQTYQYDVDTRVGQDLDDFLALFGFARLAAKRATGRLTFTRGTPAPAPILIPLGTQVLRPATSVTPQVIFQTVVSAVIPEGAMQVEVPIEAVSSGLGGNVPAQTITSIATSVPNVSGAFNTNATSGGDNDETDNAFRVRFKNNFLRNIAGTPDQLLAIAISSILTNRATILSPMSRFSEYLQIDGTGEATSNNPYSKYTYDYDYFLTTNGNESSDIYYPNVDYYFSVENNKPKVTIAKNLFVAPTIAPTVEILNPNGNVGGTDLQWGYTFLYNFTAPNGDATLGESTISPASSVVNTDDPVSFTVTVPVGASGVVERRVYRKYLDNWYNIGVIEDNTTTTFTDNTTAFGDPPPKDNLESGGIYYFEHAYLSQNSRNVFTNDLQILNKVDLYISGEDVQVAKDALIAPPVSGSNNTVFVNDSNSKFFVENFIRDFDGSAPRVGNSFIQLIWTPVISIPSSITIGNATYVENQDYYLIRDISNLRNSSRARDGIECNSNMASAINGSRFVIEYGFNRLPIMINQIAEQHKQTTQDVLVHSANLRYFNVNLVVMYDVGTIKEIVDDSIRAALNSFFTNLNFGSIIQMSDITSVVHGVIGVDNVRIATIQDDPINFGVQEVNSEGEVLAGIPHTDDFFIGDIELAVFNILGPTENGPIQRTTNTWIVGI